MAKPKKNSEREERIRMEMIVDAHDSEEVVSEAITRVLRVNPGDFSVERPNREVLTDRPRVDRPR